MAIHFFTWLGGYRSKEIIKAVLAWAEQNNDRLELLNAEITHNDRELNGFTFFHLVGKYRRYKDIAELLEWARQDDARLGLLKIPIRGNDKGLNGHTFFHLVARSLNNLEKVKAILKWV